MELTEFREPMTRCHDLVDYDAGNVLDQAMEAADLEAIGVGQFIGELLLLIEDREAAVDQIRRAGDVVAVP